MTPERKLAVFARVCSALRNAPVRNLGQVAAIEREIDALRETLGYATNEGDRMKTNSRFSSSDRKFLRSVGIRADDTPLYADRLPAAPEDEFSTTSDPVLDWMRKNNLTINRENYLAVAYMGTVQELDAETEAELPDCLREDCGDE
jgi:hypothetical protein